MTSQEPSAAFSITPEHVQNAGVYIQQTAQSLLTGVRATDSDVDGLLAGWRGPASESFRTGWVEVCTGVIGVLESLDVMAEALGVAGVTLSDQDRDWAGDLAVGSSLDLP
ncbi:WXG100 family type VII secretion target [Nocardia mangyaensis]|uniref:WXG100 family type VII secretion target n=1 Tax=Nocardia mangyaensis TaxID=2213200 RepID=UPI002675ABC1|nr:WXG100 family type VII secretion target [Nocardia mangyaensis]MDO3645879.1 WXG100 family type VII secretion target [Nocardia mangyaensis]